jgi:hypothetical protein
LKNFPALELDYQTATELATLPLECYNKEYPYKMGIVLNGAIDVQVLTFFAIKLTNEAFNFILKIRSPVTTTRFSTAALIGIPLSMVTGF